MKGKKEEENSNAFVIQYCERAISTKNGHNRELTVAFEELESQQKN